jgi:hypothetical protein
MRRPYLEVWKLAESFADRQYRMWPRLESDPRLIQHARKVWMSGRPRPPVATEQIARVCEETRLNVQKIRARGGEVVFIRPPSGGDFYERELRNVPRSTTWDRLLEETGAFGIHFEDHPAMQGLEIPEWSHLSGASATRFTRAYVDVLTREMPWLRASQTGETS